MQLRYCSASELEGSSQDCQGYVESIHVLCKGEAALLLLVFRSEILKTAYFLMAPAVNICVSAK